MINQLCYNNIMSISILARRKVALFLTEARHRYEGTPQHLGGRWQRNVRNMSAGRWRDRCLSRPVILSSFGRLCRTYKHQTLEQNTSKFSLCTPVYINATETTSISVGCKICLQRCISLLFWVCVVLLCRAIRHPSDMSLAATGGREPHVLPKTTLVA